MAPFETPQLRFLKNASDWLISQSPSTSAHLLGVHTRLLHEDTKPVNSKENGHHCIGCGNIWQPNWRKVTRVSREKRKGKARGSKPKPGGVSESATIYKCLRCQQRTILSRQKTSSKSSRSTSTPLTTPATSAAATSAPISLTSAAPPISEPSSSNQDTPKSGENANSKKRAKARKQGGLQALLASKQRPEPSLDLFDFLQ